MGYVARFRLPALLCVLILPLCALIVHPVLEMGMIDDFSYTKSALTLAQTGHIVYVGWAAAIVGWQLYLGALFIKLFGFSFTVVRLSTLLTAMLTAFLTQRAFARSGLNEWNATLGALALILSPLTLALTFSYMTDMGGLFCIVLCFYACLRALQATSTGAMLGWIVFAALSNAVGGTVRQVAWLGVIVMVPCTCWLLRHRRFVIATGVISCLASYGFIFAALRWFAHQPYSQANVGAGGGIDAKSLLHLSGQIVRSLPEVPFLLLPLLVLFLFAVPPRVRRLPLIAIAVCALLALVTVAWRHHSLEYPWLAPYITNYMSRHGFVDGRTIHGERPVVLNMEVRLAISMLLFAAIVYFFGYLWSRPVRLARPALALETPTWKVLATLLGPFAAAYYLLLFPRGLQAQLFDRYLLPLFAVAIVLFIRFYQDYVANKLPRAALVTILIFGAYGVIGMRDVFAMDRAYLQAIHEVLASGVPASQIDGSFDFDGWTQIQEGGHINSPDISFPAGAYVPGQRRPGLCFMQDELMVPKVHPTYAISFDSNACGGPSGFAPVTYHAWLGPHTVNFYIVWSALSHDGSLPSGLH